MKKAPAQRKLRDADMLFEISCLRHMPRAWKRFLSPDFANNAEHIFRVTWIALILAARENLTTTDRVLKMALIHDLGESRTGDVDYLSRQYTKRSEDAAMHDMLYQTSVEEELMPLWKEYEKRETIEAKIVKDADTLDVEIDLKEAAEQGHTIGALWNKQRKANLYPKLFTQSAKQLWEELHNTNPHAWHMKGQNRFNSGDWKKK